jgi:hypothetical protein
MPSTHSVSNKLVQADILGIFLRAFRRKLLPIRGVFSTVFNGRVDGNTNDIPVPYIPLDAVGSVLIADGEKYSQHAKNTATEARTITINRQRASVLSFSSKEKNRNRFLSVEEHVRNQAERLASDVIADVMSVFTPTNFAGATIPAVAAADFDFQSAAKLREKCEEADWPMENRHLILLPPYITGLFAGLPNITMTRLGDQLIEEGTLPRVETFRPVEFARLPHNNVRLRGVACLPSAVGLAFAPIEPDEAIRQQLSRYELITDEETGLQMVYKAWGDPDANISYEVVECSYGFAPIESAAAKLIVEPAPAQ